MKLDLGCGNNKKKGFIGVDIDKNSEADYFVDFEKDRLPFEDNSVEEVNAHHIMEHMHDLYFVMKELYRVCENNAIIIIEVPHYKYKGAFSNPAHCRYFTEDTFYSFDKSYDKLNKYSQMFPDVDFKVLKIIIIRGKYRFWKPYAIKFILKVVK